MKKVAVIIVTYNSQLHIPKAMECLQQQTLLPSQIIIVDTGSHNMDYLKAYERLPHVQIITVEKESGFCKGNNLGFAQVHAEQEYVFLLNPDAFLTPHYLEKAVEFMEHPNYKKCGAVTGITLGYDMHADKPTGKYDTTGIKKNGMANGMTEIRVKAQQLLTIILQSPSKEFVERYFFVEKKR